MARPGPRSAGSSSPGHLEERVLSTQPVQHPRLSPWAHQREASPGEDGHSQQRAWQSQVGGVGVGGRAVGIRTQPFLPWRPVSQPCFGDLSLWSRHGQECWRVEAGVWYRH